MRDRLLAFFDPSRSIALFIVGTAALTVAVTAVYDTAKDEGGLVGAWIVAAGLVLVAVAVVVFQGVRAGGTRVNVRESMRPTPKKGLVVLVSAHAGTATASIEYHIASLKACWLVGSEQAVDTMQELHMTYGFRIGDLRWGSPYLVDPERVKDTYDVVTRIIEHEAQAVGLGRLDLIADITGGQKPMTVGMALACLANNTDMQYMKSHRDVRGQADPAVEPVPIKIDTAFRNIV